LWFSTKSERHSHSYSENLKGVDRFGHRIKVNEKSNKGISCPAVKQTIDIQHEQGNIYKPVST